MRKALLYIKGLKEPVEFTEEEGISAEQMMVNAEIPNEALFSIENVWTGHKGDMKHVVWIKQRDYRVEEEEEKPLTPEEQARVDKARKETGDWLKEKGIIK